MSLFLKDFNGVVRFFPKFFFQLVMSFGHCDKAEFWVARLQNLMEKALLKKPC